MGSSPRRPKRQEGLISEIEMGRSDQGVRASAGRYAVIPRVLVFVFNCADVLLLKGAPTKRIWANRYNGVGGHVEAHEDVYSAAARETREETGLDPQDLALRGVVNIDVGPADDGSHTGILMFVFSASSDRREVRPSGEGTLEWVPLDRLAKYDVVDDLPAILQRIRSAAPSDPPFFARYAYDDADRLQIDFAP